ncbi:hypothetical protein [Paenibacillus sp. UNC451MF]|uniref:hypothetical protein n=1 Tax=Paenibacillus sp. UNC451MF TaxID=1449063 RepID=UPI00048E7336|nr:hypothetical protein [Paenibacillus sp. UNC451MF]
MNRELLMLYCICGLFIVTIAACSQTYQVTTASTKALNQELREMSSTITLFRCSFTRPQLTCRVALSREPDEQLIDSLLVKVKAFSTLDNLDEIARKVHWNDHIWTIRLVVGTDRDVQTTQYEYSASYYRYHIDHSIQEVDAYQTWSLSK